jgi:excisionase family DNA binding protein
MQEFMNTAEVADYLRIKERTVYELVRTRRIPCSRVTGRWLFPKRMIDLWVTRNAELPDAGLQTAPPVVAGSHDPLLEWAVRESGCELALLSAGSEDGLRRLAAGQALVAGLHLIDPDSGTYNLPTVAAMGRLTDIVLIEWAWRDQGLVVPPGNPLGITALEDLKAKRARVARRQDGAGTQILLRHLLDQAGVAYDELQVIDPPMRTETDLAAAVLDGKADCGLAIRAVARRFRLDFVPLHRERFDLAMRRRDYFEPALQTLFRFTRSSAFAERAQELGGYDIRETGRVVYNA